MLFGNKRKIRIEEKFETVLIVEYILQVLELFSSVL